MLPGLVFTGLMDRKYDAPGSQIFPAFGTSYFIVPDFSSNIVFTLYGAGAGGGGYGGSGGTGGNTEISVLSLFARGAGSNGAFTTGGVPSGGDTNLTGNNSPTAPTAATGWDNRANGGTGGDVSEGGDPKKGFPPTVTYYSGGAAGSKLVKTITVGNLSPGTNLMIVIGKGGDASDSGATAGSNGYISIVWN